MRATPNLRSFPPALAGAMSLLLAGACGDDVQAPLDDGTTEALSPLIVSNPVVSASAVASSASSIEGVVFVSLPPGSVSNGVTAVVRTRSTGAEATAAMVDGGFDPIAVAAGAGDTLEIRIERSGAAAPLRFHTVVPLIIVPMVVRTEPPPRKRDVPLNAVMRIVFSEPIHPATLTATTVQVIRNGVPVAGTLQFADPMYLSAMFTPAGLLAPGADYSILISTGIEDLDGDALAEEVRVDFSTAAPPPPGTGTLAIVSGNHQPGKAGSELPEPLVVRVTDARGTPVPDVNVRWTVTSGEGVLDGQWYPCFAPGRQELWAPRPATSVRTDADGLARISFMPTWFGPVTVSASVGGATPVTFTTDASDAGATLEIVPGNGDAHERWVWSFFGWIHHPPFVVTVKDGQGNPVPYIGVNWRVESGVGAFDACGWSMPGAAQLRTEGDGFPQSRTNFQPMALGSHTVTATVPGIQDSPGVTFEVDATVALIWLETVDSVVVFSGPDGRGHSDVVVPVGARVEFSVIAPTGHIVSTSSPSGGLSFDSGILNRNPLRYNDPAATPLFGFVPNVAGTWTFVDQVSGATGTLTAR